MIEFEIGLTRGDFRLDATGAAEGGITGLFGSSGAGKTTLLHALAGLEPISRGSIVLDGRTLFDAAQGIDLPPEARGVGVVFQDGRLFPHLDVAENLRFGARAARGRSGAPPFGEVVEILELGALLERRPDGLSGGERQRVGLGRALLAAPRILLLDEPLAALDRARRGQILPYLRRLVRRFPVPALYVSHDLPELLSLTERLMLLEGGRVQASGHYRELALRPEWLGPGSPLGRVNVLRGRVLTVEGETCRVRFDDGSGELEIEGVGSDLEPGASASVVIGAEEIALATGEWGATSIQNQIAARVTERSDHEGATVLEIRAGVPLLVEVTTRSAERLELVEGAALTALIKASAVRVRGER